jgi:hypothetical protein
MKEQTIEEVFPPRIGNTRVLGFCALIGFSCGLISFKGEKRSKREREREREIHTAGSKASSSSSPCLLVLLREQRGYF